MRGINLIAQKDSTGAYEHYYQYNYHGDVTELTDNIGSVVKSYKYDAFGNEENPDSLDNNPYRYTGEYFDEETGTIYLRARYYNPATGRFLNQDSYLGNSNDPLSLNLYTYAHNNPVMGVDPSGHWFETALDILSLADSLVTIFREPSLINAGFLVWDVVSLVPFVPGSYVAKGVRYLSKTDNIVDGVKAVAKYSDEAVAFVKKSDDIIDAGKTAKKSSKNFKIDLQFFAGKSDDVAEKNFVVFNKTHKNAKPKPRVIGPNNGRLQSHHGLQGEWARNNLSKYGYNYNKAPTVTIETAKGLPHTIISNLQNGRRDARKLNGTGVWSSSLQDELGYIIKDFSDAGFSNNTIKKVLNQQYDMLDKLKAPYQKINF